MTAKTDILLKEYEACQSHNNALGSQLWTSTTIFMSINVTLLGGIVYGFLQSGILDAENLLSQLFASIGIAILGTGVIFILFYWKSWLKRVRFHTRMNNERMRDIEKKLGMAKNHLAVGFDWKDDCNYKEEWKELSNDIKKKIEYISGKSDFKKAPRAGFNSVNYIVRTTIALWSVVLLASVASILFLGITNSWKFC